ncbi:MAG: hypothetical protein JJV98_04685, partial [Desulfosarcina sp.]|nr:hypothetical protein [Desulfobacterales bacterium]
NNPFYGFWILGAELILGGVIPALMLVIPKIRSNPYGLFIAATLGVIGVSLNRWVMILQVMAVPVMSFDQWVMYIPSWQEVATTILPVAYGVILVMISYRYLPVFPNEAELNPIEPETPPAIEAESKEEGETENVQEPEMAPAKA